jgi:hypothetical protein
MLRWEIKLRISVKNFIVNNCRGPEPKRPKNAFDREDGGGVESGNMSVCLHRAVLAYLMTR